MRYCVINSAARIVNIIEWDGQTAYTPGDGLTLREWEEGEQIFVPRFSADAVTVEACRAALRAEISAKRKQLEQLGVTFEFPDGVGVIQTRDDTDVRNVQGNTTAATVLKLQGVTEAALTFRTEDNVNHALTPSEAIAMGMAVAARVQELYAFKWAHDEAIEMLETVEVCEAYDIEQGWG